MKILVTGAAGFIGYHVAQRLLERGDVVVGVDNMDPYYDPRLNRRGSIAWRRTMPFALSISISPTGSE